MASTVSELRRKIHDEGYETKKDRKGHWNVYRPNGELVRTDKGVPLTLSDTPSNPNWLNRATTQLRAAKVLPPLKEPLPRVKGTKSKAQVSQLRGDLAQLLIDHKLSQSDFYHFGNQYHEQHRLAAPLNPQGMTSKFLRGAGVSDLGFDYLRRTVDAIKASNGNVPSAQEIRERMTPPAPQPEKAKDVGVEVEGESQVHVTRLPDLAFETMQLIYREEKDEDAILDLVQRIARLELG